MDESSGPHQGEACVRRARLRRGGWRADVYVRVCAPVVLNVTKSKALCAYSIQLRSASEGLHAQVYPLPYPLGSIQASHDHKET